jgi:nicotinamidase-related amidase
VSRIVLGKEVFTTLEEKLRPAHTCLLIVDLQNDFCSPGGGADQESRGIENMRAIINPLSRLMVKARALRVAILNIKMTTYEDGHTNSAVDLARRLTVWKGERLTTRARSWGHDNPSDVPFDTTDVVVQKHRNNAFLGTNLESLLRRKGVRTVIVTGLSTQACVLETALAAQGLDFYVIVPTDCVASTSPELHHAGLLVLKSTLHSEGLTSSEQIITVWSEQR